MRIEVVSPTDRKLKKTIAEFRKTNPGKTSNRSVDEQRIHDDKYCSDTDISEWIVAVDDNKISGTIAVFTREITVDGQIVQLGGIGKVRVAVDQRKKGIGNKLMKAAIQQLHDNQVDVAFLCTNLESFLAEWYKKYGFQILPKQYTYTGASDKKYIENNGMLAAIRSKDVFDNIMNSPETLDIGTGNW